MLSYKNWKTLNENMMPSFNLGVAQPQSMGMVSNAPMGQDAGSGSDMSDQSASPDSDTTQSSEETPQNDDMVSKILEILKDDDMSNKEKAEKIANLASGSDTSSSEEGGDSSQGEGSESGPEMSGSAEAPKTEAYHMFGDDEDAEDDEDEDDDEDMDDEGDEDEDMEDEDEDEDMDDEDEDEDEDMDDEDEDEDEDDDEDEDEDEHEHEHEHDEDMEEEDEDMDDEDVNESRFDQEYYLSQRGDDESTEGEDKNEDDYEHDKIRSLKMNECDGCNKPQYTMEMKYIMLREPGQKPFLEGVYCPKCIDFALKQIMKQQEHQGARVEIGMVNDLDSSDFHHDLPPASKPPEYGLKSREKLGLKTKFSDSGKDKPKLGMDLAQRLKQKKNENKEEASWWNSVNSMLGYEGGTYSDGISTVPSPDGPKAGEIGFAPQGRIGWFQ